ncbi:hypothetical protein AQI88_16615 [Streptomyces cellostaticus]|uniref:Uncharacterized protein n=1 Tax=Streptomyces cellostaticus TaxID=67285 RepID=A0A101NLV8_9ACTN|nr:hypothetical protein [Streptomyces cellostaticus]KUM95683.1 hypothetical protein AQI88_16615 [Streptomyces cellostaticus]GHI09718.1 hypothetical protein Scel_80390 [Streptomyces cellostaticus]
MPLSAEDFEAFLSDVVLCLSIQHRGRVVVVWPRGADAVVETLSDHYERQSAADAGDGSPPGRLAARLKELLGEAVTVTCRALSARGSGSDPELIYRTESDTLLLTIRGGFRLRVSPFDAAHEPEPLGPLTLRLRAGEVIYTPRGFICEFSEARARCLLLELSLGAQGSG